MILARVKGTMVTAVRAQRAQGARYLIVEPCTPDGKEAGQAFVALDTMSSGPGEVVLVSQGSSARQTAETKDKPVDAVIIGIVDLVEKKGKLVFKK